MQLFKPLKSAFCLDLAVVPAISDKSHSSWFRIKRGMEFGKRSNFAFSSYSRYSLITLRFKEFEGEKSPRSG